MERYWLIVHVPMAYQNPVYSRDFADPFVLKYRGTYWAYCTGFQADGRVFGILRSDDLVHWDPSGGAMEPLRGGHTCYWAPEVTHEDDGSFLMYYSVGNEEHMLIRVARADAPSGPFVDLGVELTKEPFAIDAHVFKDDDGSRYLFYATDFLQHTHIGTGTVVAKMKDAYSLDGDALPVTRAKYDWQVYDPKRASKGGVRWHTVEGPFVLKHKGTYYEMFSGGNWQNITYGVSFATSDRVLRSDEWEQYADGEKILPILRTHPGRIVGPGHNSAVRGPNNRDLFCVYHEWVNNQRVLAIDRLDWRGRDMILLGPTSEPTPGPFRPRKIGNTATSDHRVHFESHSCLVEFSISMAEGDALDVLCKASDGKPVFQRQLVAGEDLPPLAWHLVRLEFDTYLLKIHVGEVLHAETVTLPATISELQLLSVGTPNVGTIELTPGWEDLFDATDSEALRLRGWQPGTGGLPSLIHQELQFRSDGVPITLRKDLGISGDFELTFNLRLDPSVPHSRAELTLGDEMSIRLFGTPDTEDLQITTGGILASENRIGSQQGAYHQIRVLYLDGAGRVTIDGDHLGTFPFAAGRQLALHVTGSAAFDMVRVTEIVSA